MGGLGAIAVAGMIDEWEAEGYVPALAGAVGSSAAGAADVGAVSAVGAVVAVVAAAAVVAVVAAAAAVADVSSRRRFWRCPFTPSIFSRRCLAHRRAFLSEAYPNDGWQKHP